MEYGRPTVCRRNMDVEEGGHSTTGIVWNVDLEKVNENQLDWTSIQSRGFGHGGWKQKLDEHHLTKAETLVRSCVEKWIPSVYSLRRQNGRVKNLWETEWYDDRLDEEQRRGIWTHKEKILWQRRLASLEAWICLKRQSTQEGEAPPFQFFHTKHSVFNVQCPIVFSARYTTSRTGLALQESIKQWKIKTQQSRGKR